MAPILLITFNRPEHTRRVLSAIIEAHPQDLFVFQDGIRMNHSLDVGNCKRVRAVIDSMVAETGIHIHTYFPDHNLGCGPGPAAAITWFFDNVTQGIILEDDAVPHPDFFSYAEQLLNRYKNEASVRAIGSMNVDTQKWGDGSFYFSMMNRNLCAWATWRRAWESFDINLKNISRRDLRQALKQYECGVLERTYWCDRLDEVHKNCCDGKSWDMQFFMSIWLNNGKGIIPNVNLSSNIGTVEEATHAMAKGNLIDNVPTAPILPLTYPSSENIQNEADRQFHFRYFEPNKTDWTKGQILYYIINKTIKKLVGHQGPWIRHK